jgi:hypothetical protein
VDTGFTRQKEGEILLVGHSFVRRLRDYVGNNYSIGGYKVQCVCRGGWKVPDVDGRLPVEMSDRRYICVGVEIGSNDLCDENGTGDLVAGRIFCLAKKLRDEYGVVKVVVFEVLEQEKECGWLRVTLGEYNDRVRVANYLLEEWCKEEEGIAFRTNLDQSKRLGKDGIHIKDR